MLKNIEEFEDYDELDPIDGVLCAVLVDGREAYKTYNHPLWVLFHNGFEEDAPFVPRDDLQGRCDKFNADKSKR